MKNYTCKDEFAYHLCYGRIEMVRGFFIHSAGWPACGLRACVTLLLSDILGLFI